MSDEAASLWTDDSDELRRAFIISHIPWSPDHKTRSQIKAMEALFQWLKKGTVPRSKKIGPIH